MFKVGVAALAMLLVAAAALGAAPRATDDGVVFSLEAPGAAAVFLAGDFNGWNAADRPLQRGAGDSWSVAIKLAPGTYEYKFIVDGDWREDAGNPERKSDPFGGANSVVTVLADGSLAGSAAAPAAPSANAAAKPAAGQFKAGPPQAVDGGIVFTFKDAGAGKVNLAGTFNGWNAEDLPLASDGKGTWSVVKELPAGQHEYKFVVDGNWLADPQNPDTVSDPYGGANSVVTVDAQGQLTATVAAAPTAGNNTLNAKVVIDGRYLTRMEFAKNVPVDVGDETRIDPRYRLQRPTQGVDLNFRTEVSDAADTYMRLRFDSNQNIIQNNVAAMLDEAQLRLHPEKFSLRAYWNQEMFTGEDLLRLGGDLDLDGTIMHDHLDYGKGTAGALFEAERSGVKARLFFANAHNHDYYNDPDLFDNLGEDRLGLRLSRKYGKFEIGAPLLVERSLVWLDFGTLVGLSSTGIAVLDEHRANTGDTSTWYEVDTVELNGGVDLRYLANERWTLGAEALYRESVQRLTTGNESGQNNTNGSIDLPFFERDGWRLAGQVDFVPSAGHDLSLRHQALRMTGGDPDQRRLEYSFQPQATANKQVLFSVGDSPAAADLDSTELTWNWTAGDRAATVWLRRASRDYDYAAVGRTAPEDAAVSAHTAEAWHLAGRYATGATADRYGHAEIEAGLSHTDRGVAGLKHRRLEVIVRYDRDLTRTTGLIADLRFAGYHLEGPTGAEEVDTDYFNPFVGLRYTPIRKVQLVAGYGVDPVDYSIDYAGRELGRWMYRQNYLFDHPGATNLDAENYLKKARVVTLRAQLLF